MWETPSSRAKTTWATRPWYWRAAQPPRSTVLRPRSSLGRWAAHLHRPNSRPMASSIGTASAGFQSLSRRRVRLQPHPNSAGLPAASRASPTSAVWSSSASSSSWSSSASWRATANHLRAACEGHSTHLWGWRKTAGVASHRVHKPGPSFGWRGVVGVTVGVTTHDLISNAAVCFTAARRQRRRRPAAPAKHPDLRSSSPYLHLRRRREPCIGSAHFGSWRDACETVSVTVSVALTRDVWGHRASSTPNTRT